VLLRGAATRDAAAAAYAEFRFTADDRAFRDALDALARGVP